MMTCLNRSGNFGFGPFGVALVLVAVRTSSYLEIRKVK